MNSRGRGVVRLLKRSFSGSSHILCTSVQANVQGFHSQPPRAQANVAFTGAESGLSNPQLPNPVDLGAMHGVKVVDFGQYIAGPLTARILCDEGAEVIHVDPLNGPMWQSPANAVLNRGKKCVQLDLKTPEGVETAKKLIESADVVIENFRPGVMDRLGLGSADAKAINPKLVYLSMPGFASTDKELAEVKAFEGIIMGSTGVFSDMGLNRMLRGVNPSFSPLALASTYSSVMGAISASLALYSRDHHGDGDVIEVCECH